MYEITTIITSHAMKECISYTDDFKKVIKSLSHVKNRKGNIILTFDGCPKEEKYNEGKYKLFKLNMKNFIETLPNKDEFIFIENNKWKNLCGNLKNAMKNVDTVLSSVLFPLSPLIHLL